jgi:hypothetical protein
MRLSFLPHLAKILHQRGNNPGVHVDLSNFWTLNQLGRGELQGRRDFGVNWLWVGWAGAFFGAALMTRASPGHGAMSRQYMSVMCGLF